MTDRPAYKSHPLWTRAMALARDAYALADRVKDASPETAKGLRKAAVAVPAHVAGAITDSSDKRREHVLAARGALAEVARQAARAPDEAAKNLTRLAETLDLSVLFEFGATGALS